MMRLGWSRRRGTAAVEFGLIAPVMAFALLAVTDLGLAIEQRERLQTAARAGAQVALFTPTDQAAIQAAVCTAAGAPQTAAAAALSLGVCPATGDLSNLTPSSTVTCLCRGVSQSCTTACDITITFNVIVGVSRPYSRLTPVAPTTVAADVKVQVN
jgi:Flp pilus assembly protein TadG